MAIQYKIVSIPTDPSATQEYFTQLGFQKWELLYITNTLAYFKLGTVVYQYRVESLPTYSSELETRLNSLSAAGYEFVDTHDNTLLSLAYFKKIAIT
jgi:hypothetical protein